VAEGLSLLIVGDGPERSVLEELARHLECGDLVTFTGSVDAKDTPSLIESAGIFALNSSYEGMSFALLEARERGLPVVVGRNSGNEAVVRSGVDGLVVDPESVSDVRTALRSLRDNPVTARTLGDKARQDVVDHYSLGATTTATLDLLERVSRD